MLSSLQVKLQATRLCNMICVLFENFFHLYKIYFSLISTLQRFCKTLGCFRENKDALVFKLVVKSASGLQNGRCKDISNHNSYDPALAVVKTRSGLNFQALILFIMNNYDDH